MLNLWNTVGKVRICHIWEIQSLNFSDQASGRNLSSEDQSLRTEYIWLAFILNHTQTQIFWSLPPKSFKVGKKNNSNPICQKSSIPGSPINLLKFHTTYLRVAVSVTWSSLYMLKHSTQAYRDTCELFHLVAVKAHSNLVPQPMQIMQHSTSGCYLGTLTLTLTCSQILANATPIPSSYDQFTEQLSTHDCDPQLLLSSARL